MTYTIWMCCGKFEQAKNSEEALSLAVCMMNSDCGHLVLGVEGPNGEDLMEQAEELDEKRGQEWMEQQRVTPKRIGYIEVLGPKGKWWGKVPCYNAEEREQKAAKLAGEYGQDRVRWVDDPGR